MSDWWSSGSGWGASSSSQSRSSKAASSFKVQPERVASVESGEICGLSVDECNAIRENLQQSLRLSQSSNFDAKLLADLDADLTRVLTKLARWIRGSSHSRKTHRWFGAGTKSAEITAPIDPSAFERVRSDIKELIEQFALMNDVSEDYARSILHFIVQRRFDNHPHTIRDALLGRVSSEPDQKTAIETRLTTISLDKYVSASRMLSDESLAISLSDSTRRWCVLVTSKVSSMLLSMGMDSSGTTSGSRRTSSENPFGSASESGAPDRTQPGFLSRILVNFLGRYTLPLIIRLTPFHCGRLHSSINSPFFKYNTLTAEASLSVVSDGPIGSIVTDGRSSLMPSQKTSPSLVLHYALKASDLICKDFCLNEVSERIDCDKRDVNGLLKVIDSMISAIPRIYLGIGGSGAGSSHRPQLKQAPDSEQSHSVQIVKHGITFNCVTLILSLFNFFTKRSSRLMNDMDQWNDLNSYCLNTVLNSYSGVLHQRIFSCADPMASFGGSGEDGSRIGQISVVSRLQSLVSSVILIAQSKMDPTSLRQQPPPRNGEMKHCLLNGSLYCLWHDCYLNMSAPVRKSSVELNVHRSIARYLSEVTLYFGESCITEYCLCEKSYYQKQSIAQRDAAEEQAAMFAAQSGGRDMMDESLLPDPEQARHAFRDEYTAVITSSVLNDDPRTLLSAHVQRQMSLVTADGTIADSQSSYAGMASNSTIGPSNQRSESSRRVAIHWYRYECFGMTTLLALFLACFQGIRKCEQIPIEEFLELQDSTASTSGFRRKSASSKTRESCVFLRSLEDCAEGRMFLNWVLPFVSHHCGEMISPWFRLFCEVISVMDETILLNFLLGIPFSSPNRAQSLDPSTVQRGASVTLSDVHSSLLGSSVPVGPEDLSGVAGMAGMSEMDDGEINESQMKMDNLWDIMVKIALLAGERRKYMGGDTIFESEFKNTEMNIVVGSLRVFASVAHLTEFQNELFKSTDTQEMGDAVKFYLKGLPSDQFAMSDILVSLLQCGFGSETNSLVIDCIHAMMDSIFYEIIPPANESRTLAGASAGSAGSGSSAITTTRRSQGRDIVESVTASYHGLVPKLKLCSDPEYQNHRNQWRKEMAEQVWKSLKEARILGGKQGIQMDLVEGAALTSKATYPASVSFTRLIHRMLQYHSKPLPSAFFTADGFNMLEIPLSGSVEPPPALDAGTARSSTNGSSETTREGSAPAVGPPTIMIPTVEFIVDWHRQLSVFDCLRYARNLVFWRWNDRIYNVCDQRLDLSSNSLAVMLELLTSLDSRTLFAKMENVLSNPRSELLFPLSDEEQRRKQLESMHPSEQPPSFLDSSMDESEKFIQEVRMEMEDDFRVAHIRDEWQYTMREFPAFEILCDFMSCRSKTLDVLISQCFRLSFDSLRDSVSLASKMANGFYQDLISPLVFKHQLKQEALLDEVDEQDSSKQGKKVDRPIKVFPSLDIDELNPEILRKCEENLLMCLKVLNCVMAYERDCIEFISNLSVPEKKGVSVSQSFSVLSRLDLRPLSDILLSHTEYRRIVPNIAACINYQSMVDELLMLRNEADNALYGSSSVSRNRVAREIPAVAVSIMNQLLKRSNESTLSSSMKMLSSVGSKTTGSAAGGGGLNSAALEMLGRRGTSKLSAIYGAAASFSSLTVGNGHFDQLMPEPILRVFESNPRHLDTLRMALANPLTDLEDPTVCVGILDFLLSSLKVLLIQRIGLKNRGLRHKSLKQNLALILLNLTHRIDGILDDDDDESAAQSYLMDLIMDALLSGDTVKRVLKEPESFNQDWAAYYEGLLELLLLLLKLDPNFHGPTLDTYSRSSVYGSGEDLTSSDVISSKSLLTRHNLSNPLIQSLALILEHSRSQLSVSDSMVGTAGLIDCTAHQNSLLVIRSLSMQCICHFFAQISTEAFQSLNLGLLPDESELISKDDLCFFGLDSPVTSDLVMGLPTPPSKGALQILLFELTTLDNALTNLKMRDAANLLVSENRTLFWGVNLEPFKMHPSGCLSSNNVFRGSSLEPLYEWDIENLEKVLDERLRSRFGKKMKIIEKRLKEGSPTPDRDSTPTEEERKASEEASRLVSQYHALVADRQAFIELCLAENQFRKFERSLGDCFLRFSQMVTVLFNLVSAKQMMAVAQGMRSSGIGTQPSLSSDAAITKLIFDVLGALDRSNVGESSLSIRGDLAVNENGVQSMYTAPLLSAHSVSCLSKVIVHFWSQIAMKSDSTDSSGGAVSIANIADIRILISLDDLCLFLSHLIAVMIDYCGANDAYITTRLNLFETFLLFERYTVAISADPLSLKSVAGRRTGSAGTGSKGRIHEDLAAAGPLNEDIGELRFAFESKLAAVLLNNDRFVPLVGMLFVQCLNAAASLAKQNPGGRLARSRLPIAQSKTDLVRQRATMTLCNSASLALSAVLNKLLPSTQDFSDDDGTMPPDLSRFFSKLKDSAISLFDRIELIAEECLKYGIPPSTSVSSAATGITLKDRQQREPLSRVYSNLVSLLITLCGSPSEVSRTICSEVISHDLVTHLLLPRHYDINHRSLLPILRLVQTLLDQNPDNVRLQCQVLNGLIVLSPHNRGLFVDAFVPISAAAESSAASLMLGNEEFAEYQRLAHSVVASLVASYSFPLRLDVLESRRRIPLSALQGTHNSDESTHQGSEQVRIAEAEMANVLNIDTLTRCLLDSCLNFKRNVNLICDGRSMVMSLAVSLNQSLQLGLSILSVIRTAVLSSISMPSSSMALSTELSREEETMVDDCCIKCLNILRQSSDTMMNRITLNNALFEASEAVTKDVIESLLFGECCELICILMEQMTVLLFNDWSRQTHAEAEERKESSRFTRMYDTNVDSTGDPMLSQMTECLTKMNEWIESDHCLLNAAVNVPDFDVDCSDTLDQTKNSIEIVISAFERQCSMSRQSGLPVSLKAMAL